MCFELCLEIRFKLNTYYTFESKHMVSTLNMFRKFWHKKSEDIYVF